MATLATIPPDIHFLLLNTLSSFPDLGAAILTARPLHAAFTAHRRKVLTSVGRNFHGSLFTDALLLARCQEKRDGSVALAVKGLSSGTVRLLMQNAHMLCELQRVLFGLLHHDSDVDVYSKPSLTKFARAPPEIPSSRQTRDFDASRSPSESESLRFKSAAYRFCVYSMLTTYEARIAFFSRFPKIQLLELSHFVSGLWTLVSVIRGRPLETNEDWNRASTILSQGPHDVLALWELKKRRDPGFKAALKAASAAAAPRDREEAEEEDFMGEWCALMDRQAFPAGAGHAILDTENERLGALLAAVEREEQEEAEAEAEVKALGRCEGRGKGKKGKARAPVSDDPFD